MDVCLFVEKLKFTSGLDFLKGVKESHALKKVN
jgi:hypothetical protein